MKSAILTPAFLLLLAVAADAADSTPDFTYSAWLKQLNIAAAATPAQPEQPLAAVPADPAAGKDATQAVLSDDYDGEKAGRLARTALNNNAGYFSGRCYEFVANFMEWTGIIKPAQWDELGIGPNSAADFAAWANANPSALRKEISMARITTPEKVSDLPLGGIVVYERGACGFSGRHGHIEVVVGENQLCSDGCQSFDASCLEDPGTRARIHIYVPVKKVPQAD